MAEMDPIHSITSRWKHLALFYNILLNCKFFCHYRQLSTNIPGGAKVATRGRAAKLHYVLRPHMSMNLPKNIIGMVISRFMCRVTWTRYLHLVMSSHAPAT